MLKSENKVDKENTLEWRYSKIKRNLKKKRKFGNGANTVKWTGILG